MSLRDIATTFIASQPLFAWLGLMTIILLLVTTIYGYALIKGKVRSIPTHKWMAVLTVLVAAVHATLAISTLFQLPI